MKENLTNDLSTMFHSINNVIACHVSGSDHI